MLCRDIGEWIEETVEKPVEEWVEQQERRCEAEECNWWVLCLNKVVCWFVTKLVKVVTMMLVPTRKFVTSTACGAVAGFLLALLPVLLLLLVFDLSLGLILLCLLILAVGVVLGALFQDALLGLLTEGWNWLFKRETLAPSPQWRPLVHFSPENGWMNDPNGLLFLDDKFHLSFQFIPYDPTIHDLEYLPFMFHSTEVCWGHATCNDFLRWVEDLKPILTADPNLGTPFSGSAVVESVATLPDDDGGLPFDDRSTRVVFMFTHRGNFLGVPPLDQRQSLAFSLDRGASYGPFPGNPVLDRPWPLIDMDFRDPKVFRFTPAGKDADPFWVAALAGGKDALFYRSDDLIHWQALDVAGGTHNLFSFFGPFVECPELVRVRFRDEGLPPRWVLLYSRGAVPGTSPTGAEYVVGEFDGRTFKEDGERRPVDFGPDLYATQSWFGLHKDRVVIGAWMSSWQYAEYVPTQPWRGNLAVPRELSLKRRDRVDVLLQWPHREFEGLRDAANALVKADRVLPAGSKVRFTDVAVTFADIVLAIDVQNAATVEVRVRVGTDQHTDISWSRESEELTLDRRASGAVDFHGDFPGCWSAPLALDEGVLRLRIVLDRSSVEVFAGDGEAVLTALVFPDLESDGLEFFASGGAAHLDSLIVYPLTPCRADPTVADG